MTFPKHLDFLRFDTDDKPHQVEDLGFLAHDPKTVQVVLRATPLMVLIFSAHLWTATFTHTLTNGLTPSGAKNSSCFGRSKSYTTGSITDSHPWQRGHRRNC